MKIFNMRKIKSFGLLVVVLGLLLALSTGLVFVNPVSLFTSVTSEYVRMDMLLP